MCSLQLVLAAALLLNGGTAKLTSKSGCDGPGFLSELEADWFGHSDIESCLLLHVDCTPPRYWQSDLDAAR